MIRSAIQGLLPAGLFAPPPPVGSTLAARTGRLSLEIVSHCWRYHHLHAYQLSSLVLFRPRAVDVTMTVFHTPEDGATVALLEHFGAMDIPGVRWHWWPLPRPELLRRAIGRNRAALASTADWVWFADCDLIFRERCLDTLCDRLQGRRDLLLFPDREHCTSLLPPDHPLLHAAAGGPRVVDVDPTMFDPRPIARAVGAYQIVHGDVARAIGYCAAIPAYLEPADRWRKTYEDRAFRRLLRTAGAPIAVPGIHRIRHLAKGRYTGGRAANWVRGTIRRIKARLLG